MSLYFVANLEWIVYCVIAYCKYLSFAEFHPCESSRQSPAIIRVLWSAIFSFPPFALTQKVEPKSQGQPDGSARLSGQRTLQESLQFASFFITFSLSWYCKILQALFRCAFFIVKSFPKFMRNKALNYS